MMPIFLVLSRGTKPSLVWGFALKRGEVVRLRLSHENGSLDKILHPALEGADQVRIENIEGTADKVQDLALVDRETLISQTASLIGQSEGRASPAESATTSAATFSEY